MLSHIPDTNTDSDSQPNKQNSSRRHPDANHFRYNNVGKKKEKEDSVSLVDCHIT